MWPRGSRRRIPAFNPVTLSETFQILLTSDSPNISTPSVPSSWSLKTPSVPDTGPQTITDGKTTMWRQCHPWEITQVFRYDWSLNQGTPVNKPSAVVSIDQLSTSSSGTEDLPSPPAQEAIAWASSGKSALCLPSPYQEGRAALGRTRYDHSIPG